MQREGHPQVETTVFNIMRGVVSFGSQNVAPLPACTTIVKLVDGAEPAGLCAGLPIYRFDQFVYTDDKNIAIAMGGGNTTIVPWHHLPLLGRYGDSAISINTVDRETRKVTSFVHHTGLTSVTEHVDAPYMFYNSVLNASSRDINTVMGTIPSDNSWINVSKEPVSASQSIDGVPLIPSTEFTSLLMAKHIAPLVNACTTAICITPKAAIHVLQAGTDRFPDHTALLVPNLIAPDPRTGLVSSWLLVSPPRRAELAAPSLPVSPKYRYRNSETGDVLRIETVEAEPDGYESDMAPELEEYGTSPEPEWDPEPEPEPEPEWDPEPDPLSSAYAVADAERSPPGTPKFFLKDHDFPPLGGT